MNNESEIIYAYTRADAIADGLQIRCPDAIRQESGIKYPVFITTTLWEHYIMPPPGLEDYGQSLDGRLWDVLWMFRFYIKRNAAGDRQYYKVIFQMPPKPRHKFPSQETVTLYAAIGPTDIDDPRPAITIMLPGED